MTAKKPAKRAETTDIAENSKKTAKPRGKAFQPGRSGNPGGRPKKTEEERTLEAMCREKTPEALATVLRIMKDGKSERSQLAAAQLVIERGHGKAIERVISDNHTTIEDRRVQGADEILARAFVGGKDGGNSGVGKARSVLPAAVHPQPPRH